MFLLVINDSKLSHAKKAKHTLSLHIVNHFTSSDKPFPFFLDGFLPKSLLKFCINELKAEKQEATDTVTER